MSVAHLLGADRMSVAEVLERHAAALGDAGRWRSHQSVLAEGTCRLDLIVGGSGTLLGTARFVAQGEAAALRLEFADPQYAGEVAVFDGKRYDVGYASPGQRSPLGWFLLSYGEILKQGLVGGVISPRWPILRREEGEAKRLKSRGLTSTEGERWWRLDYRPRRVPSELEIKLYFDPETFRLVKTEYEAEQSSGIGPLMDDSRDSVPGEAARRDVRLKLEELYSDFQETAGLVLPHRWLLRYTQDRGNATSIWQWAVEWRQIRFDVPVDPAEFQLR
jgi:hypothetical protein